MKLFFLGGRYSVVVTAALALVVASRPSCCSVEATMATVGATGTDHESSSKPKNHNNGSSSSSSSTTSSSSSSPHRLRRTSQVLRIAGIETSGRKKKQSEAMENIHRIVNRFEDKTNHNNDNNNNNDNNDNNNDEPTRQLLLANQLTDMNLQEVAKADNILMNANEMARFIERGERNFYYSMSMEPTRRPTPRPTNRPPPYSDPTYRPTLRPTDRPDPVSGPTVRPLTRPPSRSPTSPPAASPTRPPSPPPTRPPTGSPIQSPVESPTDAPVRPLTRPPTRSPTSSPIPVPTPAPIDPGPNPMPPSGGGVVCGNLTPAERRALILGQLATYSGGVVTVSGTPQNEAFQWLIEDDAAQVCPEEFLNVQQRYILAVLYFSTDGDQWTNCNALSSPTPNTCPGGDGERFLSSSDVCFWFGVSCNRLRVIGISIDENSLRGALPLELGFMEQIEDLDFDGELDEGLNFLSGTIPSTLGLLEKLVTLDLDSNQLTGTIPEEIFEAKRLTIMDLDSNELVGTLSPGFANLEELQILFLDNNGFNGAIPSAIGAMDRLRFLRLDRNELTGSIPSDWASLRRLRVMFLNNNGGISGTIPPFVGQFTDMQQLSLFDTGISGTVPSTLGQLSGLVNLFLHFTDLTGTMPQEICDLRTKGALNFLTADCAGENPKLQCSQPDCCTVCF